MDREHAVIRDAGLQAPPSKPVRSMVSYPSPVIANVGPYFRGQLDSATAQSISAHFNSESMEQANELPKEDVDLTKGHSASPPLRKTRARPRSKQNLFQLSITD